MIHELIYTSAPSTLDGPGYGAVGKSEGFPARLEKWIRQHVNQYDLPADGTRAGPAAFSHVPWEDGGQRWHICSRVGDGGYDYTRRAVFLAHHVAIPAAALPGANWAQLMREPGFFQAQWNGRVGLLPPRRVRLPAGPAASCETWRQLAGDPQWALAWGQRWQAQRPEPQFLVTRDAADVLGLFAELLALLPGEQAGGVSFLTYLNGERSGVRFDWVALPAGARMTQSMIARFPNRVLDLTQPLGPAPRLRKTIVRQHAEAPAAGSPSPAIEAWYPLADDPLPERVGAAAKAARPAAPALPPPPPDRRISRAALVAGGLGLAVLLVAAGFGLAVLLRPGQPAAEALNVVDSSAAQPSGPPGQPTAAPARPAAGPSPPREDPPQVAGNQPTAKGDSPPAGPAAPPASAAAPGGEEPVLVIAPARGAEHRDADSSPLPPPVVRYVARGQGPAALKEHEPGEWLPLWHADKPLPQPTLRMISHRQLGLEVESSRQGQQSALRIFLRGQRELGSVVVQVQGDLVRWKSAPNVSAAEHPAPVFDKLLDALRLSVLEIAARPAAQEDPQPPTRLVLTPLHPPVSLGAPREAKQVDGDWRLLYLSLAGALGDSISPEQLAALQPKLRLEGVSLSILPAASEGWPWSATLDLLQNSGSASRTRQLTLAGSEHVASLTFVARLERNKYDNEPALAVKDLKITRIEPTAGTGKSGPAEPVIIEFQQQLDDHDRPSQSAPGQPDSGVEPQRLGDPAGKRSDKKPDHKPAKPDELHPLDDATDKPAGKPRPDRPRPNPPANGHEPPGRNALGPAGNFPRGGGPGEAALLGEMLRRYGELRGSIVVTAHDGSTLQEIVVFRFGREPSSAPNEPGHEKH